MGSCRYEIKIVFFFENKDENTEGVSQFEI